jgi:hypothetical protein
MTKYAHGCSALYGALQEMFQAMEECRQLIQDTRLDLRYPKQWRQGEVQIESSWLVIKRSSEQFWVTHPADVSKLAALPPRLRVLVLHRVREVTRWFKARVDGIRKHRQECLRQQAHLYEQLQIEDAAMLLSGDAYKQIPAQYWADKEMR